jgi:hypothetical protein
METVQSPLKFVQKRFFHLKVCQGHLYTLYYNTTFSLQSDKLWSFHGLFLHGDHQQIHMKWMINYNEIPSNIFCFLNGDETWNDWNEFYLETSGPCYLSHA